MKEINLDLNEEKEYINPYKKFLNIQVPVWLACRKELKHGSKLLYGCLCKYAGKNGKCFPSQTTLARDLGCTKRTIARYLKELKK